MTATYDVTITTTLRVEMPTSDMGAAIAHALTSASQVDDQFAGGVKIHHLESETIGARKL